MSSAYKYIRQSFRTTMASKSRLYKERLVQWGKQGTVVRLEGPTNVPRARSLGYKATKEYLIARVRISKGKRARRRVDLGRKPGKNRKKVNPGVPLSQYAEGKARKNFTNLNVTGSYFIGQTGSDKYFEVILFNPHPDVPRFKAAS